MTPTFTGALLVVALISVSVATSVHKARSVGEHQVARHIKLATNSQEDSKLVAHRRVKRGGAADLREGLSYLQKIQASDAAKIAKLSSSIAMMAVAMKGDHATSKEKETVVVSAKKSASMNKEAQKAEGRSLAEVLTRSRTSLKRLISRAEFEFAKLQAIADG